MPYIDRNDITCTYDIHDVFIVVYFLLTGKMETAASLPEGINKNGPTCVNTVS